MTTKDEEAGLATNGKTAYIETPSTSPLPKKLELHPAFYVGYVSSIIPHNVFLTLVVYGFSSVDL